MGKSMNLTDDDVRALIWKEAEAFRNGRNITGIGNWARHHGLSKAYVSEVMTGKKPPREKILAALGLELVIVKKKKA
jgi:hypothetical protein